MYYRLVYNIGGEVRRLSKHYEQRKEANKRYLEKQDELKIRIPKGQKATIQAAAAAAAESVNEYTQKALLARMGLESWPERKEENPSIAEK